MTDNTNDQEIERGLTYDDIRLPEDNLSDDEEEK